MGNITDGRVLHHAGRHHGRPDAGPAGSIDGGLGASKGVHGVRSCPPAMTPPHRSFAAADTKRKTLRLSDTLLGRRTLGDYDCGHQRWPGIITPSQKVFRRQFGSRPSSAACFSLCHPPTHLHTHRSNAFIRLPSHSTRRKSCITPKVLYIRLRCVEIC